MTGGDGFLFEGDQALEEMRELIVKDPQNAERIFPFLGGDDILTDPQHKPSRYVIDFWGLDRARDGAS
jgi:hypothetical protein